MVAKFNRFRNINLISCLNILFCCDKLYGTEYNRWYNCIHSNTVYYMLVLYEGMWEIERLDGFIFNFAEFFNYKVCEFLQGVIDTSLYSVTNSNSFCTIFTVITKNMHKVVFNWPLKFCSTGHRVRDRFDNLPCNGTDARLCQQFYICRNFTSERSNADSGYIRIPITSPTRPLHFPTYPEVNS